VIFVELLFSIGSANLRKLVTNSQQTIYCGFDPTARSLHIGNLVGLIGLLHWQRAGHQPIALVRAIFLHRCLVTTRSFIQLGSATVLIGDPSGRLNERKQQLTNDDIVSNTENIERLIRTIFDNHQKYFWKETQRKLAPVTYAKQPSMKRRFLFSVI
jgi:tyrosyl-tRNA synthetase